MPKVRVRDWNCSVCAPKTAAQRLVHLFAFLFSGTVIADCKRKSQILKKTYNMINSPICFLHQCMSYTSHFQMPFNTAIDKTLLTSTIGRAVGAFR